MLRFIPVWFDSMGSKSSSTYIETKDVRIFIDPGLSALQPGFPIPESWKSSYNMMGYRAIQSLASKADIIIVTHYHYDHFEDPYSPYLDARKIYGDKLILIKDPNIYINRSQHERARIFLEHMIGFFLDKPLEDFLTEPKKTDFDDPLEWIPIALNKDFGDYNRRRKEILASGKKRFLSLCDMWSKSMWIKEINEQSLHIEFADGREYTIGSTRIRFTEPMFHGIEFDRLGWVIGVVIETKGRKFLYTSDVQGPFIEDYAEWVIRENPDIVIIDGPPTYQFGYMMTRTNLRRAIENIKNILRHTDSELIIWDHHLLRDIYWRERVGEALEEAKKLGRQLITSAEFYGKKPVADLARLLKRGGRIKREEFIIPPNIKQINL